jgi:hypothetical protein
MDEKELAQQLKKTGNLMDLLNDDDWLRKNAAAESECTGYVEAGAGLQNYVQQLKQVSPEAFKAQKRQVQLLSIFLPVLHDWLATWELGLSFEAVYTEAQRLVFSHLAQSTATKAEWLEKVLVEFDPGLPAHEQSRQVRVKEKLSEMLQQEDWQVLAKVAAQDMEKRVLQRAQVRADTPIAV